MEAKASWPQETSTPCRTMRLVLMVTQSPWMHWSLGTLRTLKCQFQGFLEALASGRLVSQGDEVAKAIMATWFSRSRSRQVISNTSVAATTWFLGFKPTCQLGAKATWFQGLWRPSPRGFPRTGLGLGLKAPRFQFRDGRHDRLVTKPPRCQGSLASL